MRTSAARGIPVTLAGLLAVAVLLLLPGADGAESRERQSSGISDAVGRRIPADEFPFRRVLSLVPSATDLIVALGASDRLVGRTRYDSAPEVIDLPRVGEPLRPSLERIASLEPELVIAWARLRGRGAGANLAALDATVYLARTSSLEGVKRLTRDLGPLLGRPAAADSLGRTLECQLREVARAVSGRDRPRVAYLVWPDPIVAAGPTSYLASLIHLAGGRNAFRDAGSPWLHVGLESLVDARPEVLVLGEMGPGTPGWQLLRDEDVWPALPAVETGRVHEVPSDLFHRPGPELGRAAAALARRLHPDAAVPEPGRCAAARGAGRAPPGRVVPGTVP